MPTDEQRYGYNPFRIDSTPIRNIPSNKLQRVIREGNDGSLALFKRSSSKSDFEPHIRTYSMLWDVMWQLNRMGLRILCYVMKEVGKGKDYVYLNVNVIKDVLCVSSRTSVYLGIEELIEWKVLARSSDKDIFWVNPAFMFKGARIHWFVKVKDLDDSHSDLVKIKVDEMAKTIQSKSITKPTKPSPK